MGRTPPEGGNERAESALGTLAAELRQDPVLAEHVRDSDAPPSLGALAARGPRAAENPSAYALVVESVREGYLLHYGEPRLLAEADSDLRLLAGDYLYALGLERLAALGDLEAVQGARRPDQPLGPGPRRRRGGGPAAPTAQALWLASIVAVGAGAGAALAAAKAALRGGEARGPPAARRVAGDGATRGGMRDALTAAADSIGFAPQDLPARG